MSIFNTETDVFELVWEAYLAAGKPAINSNDFHDICDEYEFDSGDLVDLINDANEPIDPQDQVERN